MVEKQNLELQEYYRSLSRTERGKFVQYLISKFGYNYATLTLKLRGNANMKFNQRDLMLLIPEIKDEAWKN